MLELQRRPYQERIHRKILDFLLQPTDLAIRSAGIISPTGSGKTIMGLKIAKELAKQGLKVGWVAHRRELLNQADESNKRFFGVDELQFISMFTRHPEKYKDRQVLIIDEMQHDASRSAALIHEAIRPDIVIGMSATPYRTDSAKLCFQKIIRDAGIRQLIREGWLTPFKQYMIEDEWTPKNVAKTYLEDPDQWGKSVIYFLTIKDAIECDRILKSRGIRSEYIIGNSPRDDILSAFDSGELDVLTNVMVLTEGFDCLDSETEVLTDSGWRNKDQIAKDDLVYSLNRDTNQAELVPIEAVASRKVRPNERMVTVASQHLALRVTEGHEFHFKYRDPNKNGTREERLSNNFITYTGTQLVERRSEFQLPLAPPSMKFPGIDLTDDEIRLIAWFMTDGGFQQPRFVISQSEKPTKHAIHIRQLLLRLGLDFTERYRPPGLPGNYPSKYGMFEFSIPKGTSKSQPRSGWFRYQKYLNKNVAAVLHTMTRRQFQILYDEMMLGNGSRSRPNSAGWIWTAHKKQADTICMMAILRGFTSSVASEVTRHGVEVYRVTARDQRWMGICPHDIRSAKIKFENPNPNEIVWCLQNRNGTIIIRRKGKTAIIGNCPSLKTAFVRDASKGPTIQMSGRIFRLHETTPHVNVVQSKNTKFPFTRHAAPLEKWIRMESGIWRNLDMRNLEPLLEAQRRKIAQAEFELPDLLLHAKNNVRKEQRVFDSLMKKARRS